MHRLHTPARASEYKVASGVAQLESPPTLVMGGQRQEFRRDLVLKEGGVKSQEEARVQLRDFPLSVPPSVHTVAPSTPVNVTLLDTGPLNRRLAVRGVHVELLHAVLSCPPIGPWPDDVA